MKRILLTQGQYAIVDDEDLERISHWKWHFGGGYARRGNYPSWRLIYMHREVLNVPSHLDCDHINGNRLDNRKINLRVCTHAQNTKNRKLSRNNRSGFKGVHWRERDKKWSASIGIEKRRMYLGYFETREEAATSYNNAAKVLHGEFANLNKI